MLTPKRIGEAFPFRNRPLRRNLAPLLSLMSLLFVLTFAACNNIGSSTTAAPAEFRIGYLSIPNAQLIAKSLDLVEDQFPDVRVKWVPFTAGWRVLDAIAKDNIDVGLAGSVPASTAIAQGLPVQVYFIHNIIGDNEALAVTQASGIQSINDLVNKSIGVPFGSTTHFSLLSALSDSGIEASQVNILNMQPAEILSAWKRGTIDGGFIWQPILSRLIAEKGKNILTAKQLAEKGIVTADLGVVSQAFAKDYPNFLADYVRLLNQAVQFYQEDPEAVAEVVAPEIGLSQQDSLDAMSGLIWLDAAEQLSERYLGSPNQPGAISEVLKASADFMATQDAIPPAPDLKTFQQGLFSWAVEQATEAS